MVRCLLGLVFGTLGFSADEWGFCSVGTLHILLHSPRSILSSWATSIFLVSSGGFCLDLGVLLLDGHAWGSWFLFSLQGLAVQWFFLLGLWWLKLLRIFPLGALQCLCYRFLLCRCLVGVRVRLGVYLFSLAHKGFHSRIPTGRHAI